MAEGGHEEGTPLIQDDAIPSRLFYDSAPTHMVVSPGAGSYTRHLEQLDQERRRIQHLRLARGTGRQPGLSRAGRRPQQPAEDAPPTPPRRGSNAGLAVDAGGEADPLDGRRVQDPMDRMRQDNPGQDVRRTPMMHDDPRMRFYGRLRNMSRHSAQLPGSVVGGGPADGAAAAERIVEEDEGADSVGRRTSAATTVGDPSVNAEGVPETGDDDNPFDSFLEVPRHIVPAEYYAIQVPDVVKEPVTGCWQKFLRFLGCGSARDRSLYEPLPDSQTEDEEDEEEEEEVVVVEEGAPPSEGRRSRVTSESAPADPNFNPNGHSSFVTIASLWNTMMGTSLLTMPWAVGQAGLGTAIAMSLVMGLIATTTALLVVLLHKRMTVKLGHPISEFPDLLRLLLPEIKGLHIFISFFSLIAVGGALTVYWMLSSNFLYSSGNVFSAIVKGTFQADPYVPKCVVPKSNNSGGGNSSSVHHLMYGLNYPDDYEFDVTPHFVDNSGIVLQGVNDTSSDSPPIWWCPKSVPVYLGIPLVILCSFKNPSVFAKLNILGTVNIFFLIGLTAYNAATWGINLDLVDPSSAHYAPMYQRTFFCLTGALALGLFIHNAIITIMKSNRHQQNNMRDTTIGFVLVLLTYLFIGVTFYVTFPLPKTCISDNLLNNFPQNAVVMVVARFLMLLQLVSIFPLLMYILRSQFLQMFWSNPETDLSYYHCLRHSLNICLAFGFILVSIYVDFISIVIRFVGSLAGAAIIFIAPCLCHIVYMHKHGGGLFKPASLNLPVAFVEVVILGIGIANFFVQFSA